MFDIINFNNFPASMRSIFVAISLEGWILMLYNYSDSNQPFLVSVFFIFLVIFGAFFALNLVLAEVIDSYYTNAAEVKQKHEVEEEVRQKEMEQAELAKLNNASSDPDVRPVQELLKVDKPPTIEVDTI